MEELRRVVKHPHIISKYTIDPKAVVALLTLLQRRGRVTTGTYAVSKLDEPGDNMVLACALESGASFIVTGDPHLLNLKEFHKVRILSVKDAAFALSRRYPGS